MDNYLAHHGIKGQKWGVLYYTEEWRRMLDDHVDYDWGGLRYRDLSEELW